MPAPSHIGFALSALLLLVQGCTSTQVAETAPQETTTGEVPELTLNLPENPEDCVCTPGEAADHTFLEKGLSALVAGEHIEAVQYFQRYQRLESSPVADWEAGIAIAYDSMLPRSPFYDPEAARKAYEELATREVDETLVHEKVLMMRDSLETLVAMDREISKLESDNGILREDLAKREEALKRLRALTLGQKE